ncbi:uncharacterized protein IWZ02DRAFT_122571 [Phyllosticta citriasiana]|uniref:uncharacterized protein n=1 Tax=Phyllosticta citriasiana TaxID=595635 RepID=UPI0030FDAB62
MEGRGTIRHTQVTDMASIQARNSQNLFKPVLRGQTTAGHVCRTRWPKVLWRMLHPDKLQNLPFISLRPSTPVQQIEFKKVAITIQTALFFPKFQLRSETFQEVNLPQMTESKNARGDESRWTPETGSSKTWFHALSPVCDVSSTTPDAVSPGSGCRFSLEAVAAAAAVVLRPVGGCSPCANRSNVLSALRCEDDSECALSPLFSVDELDTRTSISRLCSTCSDFLVSPSAASRSAELSTSWIMTHDLSG